MKKRRIAAVVIGLALVAVFSRPRRVPRSRRRTRNLLDTDRQSLAGVHAGSPAGIIRAHVPIYMWHDSGHWHIRVTHHDNLRRSVASSSPRERSRRECGAPRESDQFQISKDKHTITFFFKNYGQIDGINFSTHCAPSIKFASSPTGTRAAEQDRDRQGCNASRATVHDRASANTTTRQQRRVSGHR